jgi:hypothetical protein
MGEENSLETKVMAYFLYKSREDSPIRNKVKLFGDRADHLEPKSFLGRADVLVQHGCNVRNQTISQDPCAVLQCLEHLQLSIVRKLESS